MISHEQLPSNEAGNTGKSMYEVDGIPISLAWKRFSPTALPQNPILENPRKPEIDHGSKAIFYFPSWGLTERSLSAGRVSQAFADTSGIATYAVDTRMAKLTAESADQEAEAARLFIEKHDIKEVTLVGSSHGGRWAITVAALLQEKNPDIAVHGVILLDSISLYEKSSKQLWHDLRKDSVRNIPLALVKSFVRTPLKRTKDVVMRRGSKIPRTNGADHLMIDGLIETTRELIRSRLNARKLVRRVATEIETNAQRNPHLSHVTAPVIMVFGAMDIVASPSEILSQAREVQIYPTTSKPVENFDKKEDQFFKDIDGREAILRNILPNSPYIRMIVAEKQGVHNLVFYRTSAVADATWSLLNRWYRQQLKHTANPLERG